MIIIVTIMMKVQDFSRRHFMTINGFRLNKNYVVNISQQHKTTKIIGSRLPHSLILEASKKKLVTRSNDIFSDHTTHTTLQDMYKVC